MSGPNRFQVRPSYLYSLMLVFEFFGINISLLVRCSPDYYIKMFPFGSSFGSYFVPPFEGVTIRDISLNKTCFCLQLYGNKPMFRGNVLSARSFFFIKIKTVYRGAFCQFPFYSSNKSTGKETGKMHLCALWGRGGATPMAPPLKFWQIS